MQNIETNNRNLTKITPRSFYGKLGGWASIGINLALFLIKGILGFVSGSLSLIADAVHTLSDMATSVIVLVTFYVTEKPSDREHPFGHGRAEFISALIISVILVVTAIEILQSSIKRTFNPVEFTAAWWIIGIIALTVLIKFGLGLYTMRLSKKINSDTLRADAWHHHLDAVSSLLVVIAFILTILDYPGFDGVVGILISLTIFYSAYGIARRPIDQLLGTPPSEELLSKIEKKVLAFPEVYGVHDIIIHNYGEMMVVSLHIEVDENLSFSEAHRISERVDKKLQKEIGAYVTVHFDPVMERTPIYKQVESKLREFCNQSPDCYSFHDLRVYGPEKDLKLMVDLVATQESGKAADSQLIEKCKRFLNQNISEVSDIQIKVEPRFSISRKSRHD